MVFRDCLWVCLRLGQRLDRGLAGARPAAFAAALLIAFGATGSAGVSAGCGDEFGDALAFGWCGAFTEGFAAAAPAAFASPAAFAAFLLAAFCACPVIGSTGASDGPGGGAFTYPQPLGRRRLLCRLQGLCWLAAPISICYSPMPVRLVPWLGDHRNFSKSRCGELAG